MKRLKEPSVRASIGFLLAFCLSVGLLMLHGCATVHQRAINAEAAGFSAPPIRVRDQGEECYLIDGRFRARYNALAAIYGNKRLDNGAPVFVPAIEQDSGLTQVKPDQWRMTLAAMEDMVVMESLKRRGAAP